MYAEGKTKQVYGPVTKRRSTVLTLITTTFAILLFLLLIYQAPSFSKDETSDTTQSVDLKEQEGTDLADSSEWRDWCEQLEAAKIRFYKFHFQLPNSLKAEGLKCQTRCTIRWNKQCIGQTILLERSENTKFNNDMLMLTQMSSPSEFPAGCDLETVDVITTFQISNGTLKYKIDKLLAGKSRHKFAPEIVR